MCPHRNKNSIKVYYIAEEINEIQLPTELENLPELGDMEESGIIGYIIIENGVEITIITNEEEYMAYIL